MRAQINKDNRVAVYQLIDRAPVAGDVDASVSLIFTSERVILQYRIKWVLPENIAPLPESLPDAGRNFCMPLLKISVQPYVHL